MGGIEKVPGWGFEVLPTDEFLEKAKQPFEVVVEITEKGHRNSSLISAPQDEIQSSLGNLTAIYKLNNLQDVTFKTSRYEVKAHKVILAAVSPVWQAMFVSNLKEGKEGQVEIVLEDDHAVVKNGIEYIYCRNEDKLKNFEALSDVLLFADKYNIEMLHNAVQRIMIQNLSSTNALKYLVCAEKANGNSLKEAALEFINQNRKYLKDDELVTALSALPLDTAKKAFGISG